MVRQGAGCAGLGCLRHGAEADDGVAGGTGDGGEGRRDKRAGGDEAPELGGERGGLVPDLAVGGERKRRGEVGRGGGVADGRGPLHRKHVVGGGEAEGRRVVEPEGEVTEVHVAVADQAAEGVAQSSGAQRGGVDQAASVEVRGGGGPLVGIGTVEGVV